MYREGFHRKPTEFFKIERLFVHYTLIYYKHCTLTSYYKPTINTYEHHYNNYRVKLYFP